MTDETNAPWAWDADWEREACKWEARAWPINTYWESLEPPPKSLRTDTIRKRSKRLGVSTTPKRKALQGNVEARF